MTATPIAAWNRFFYAPSGGQRVAAFRILLALFLLGYFGSMLPHVALMFSSQGVYTPYLVPDIAPPAAIAWALFAAMLACTVALLLGYRSELAAAALLGLFAYHYFLQLAVKESVFDRLIAFDLIVLCFADSGRVWGLDARRAPARAPVVWAERLLMAQAVLLYTGSGLWKLANPAWHTGVLLRSTMQSMFATSLAFALVRLDLSPAAWTAFSWAVIGFELSMGPLLLVRKTRPLALVLGAGFHLFNCFVLVIPEFLVAMATYPVFIQPATLQRWGDAIAMRFSARRAAA
jgi:hypothetical protein